MDRVSRAEPARTARMSLQRLEQQAAPAVAAARRLVVFHEAAPETFVVLPVLQRLLGGRFLKYDGGSWLAPEPAVLFANALIADPEAHPVVWALGAMPVPPGTMGLAARGLFPVAHPVLRCLHRLEHGVRAAADRAAPGSGAAMAPEMLRDRITRRVSDQQLGYPLVNRQTGFLFGGATSVSTEAAAGLADSLSQSVAVGLADFTTVLQAQIVALLIEAGAAFETSILIAPTARSTALAKLTAWHSMLPKAVFRRVCGLNMADLVFFDQAAKAAAPGLPLSPAGRAEVAATIGALAELTQHRRRDDAARGEASVAAEPPMLKPLLMEPDPVLGWRLRPGGSMQMQAGGVRILMQADQDSCRPVPGQPVRGEKVLAAFGCSCTYGWAVAAEDSFCAVLQRLHPSWRVENHGVENYGQVHNVLDLARLTRWDAPDYVTFTWIPTHLLRNVADILWVQKQKGDPVPGRAQPRRMTPRAVLDAAGDLQIREAAFQRTDLGGLDLADFTTDPYQLDQICFALMARAARLVAEGGGHFFVTVLRGQLSARLAGLLAGGGIPVVDASVAGPEHLGPDGHHPSIASHQHYAAAIHRYVSGREAA